MTPKVLAQDIIMDAIAVGLSTANDPNGYHSEALSGLSDKDRERTLQQLKKLADRVAKLMGYEAAWYA